MNLIEQFPLPFAPAPSLGDTDFLVTDVNREAVAWIERWPDWPLPALIIYGPKGCGKTHLAHIFHERTGGCPVDERQLRGSAPHAVLGDHRVAIVDDADQILSSDLEAGFFHLYNLARESGRHLLLTGCEPPGRWPISLADLSSRLNSCPAVGIKTPDDATAAAVLVKLFYDRQLKVDAEVVHYLVSRMERSFDAARRLVDQIDEVSRSAKRKVSPALVRAVMKGAMVPGDGGDHP